MKKIALNSVSDWGALCTRPVADFSLVSERVAEIVDVVRSQGDSALFDFTEQFDQVVLSSLQVNEDDISLAYESVDTALIDAFKIAIENVRAFHSLDDLSVKRLETMPGVECFKEFRPIERIGLYVPGGTAILPSTVIMLGVPAKLAGCNEVVMCAPPGANGKMCDEVIVAADLVGVDKIFTVGGAQAIAAMAYGTETVPCVQKIFGPGNQWVTAAKMYVQKDIAIDMPAGPSEVLVIADDQSNAEFVAADLLSQAEHGIDSQVVLVALSEVFVDDVLSALESQLVDLPRADIAKQCLEKSLFVIADSLAQAFELSNVYAPEHLIISCKNAIDYVSQVRNAGSVFIGEFSPESAGDYASGTNHVLPTSAFAQSYSGVSVQSFGKWITFQELSFDGLKKIGSTIVTMAEAEGLEAHARAVSIRLTV